MKIPTDHITIVVTISMGVSVVVHSVDISKLNGTKSKLDNNWRKSENRERIVICNKRRATKVEGRLQIDACKGRKSWKLVESIERKYYDSCYSLDAHWDEDEVDFSDS